MKITRKGFTLVELLVVIAIMGILGGMAMIGGQEATSAAKAAKIVDGLQKGAGALQTFYIDIHESIDKTGENAVATDAATLAEGASAYLKETLDANATAAKGTAGHYCVAIDDTKGPSQGWWIGYTFKDGDGDKVKAIVANKKDLKLTKEVKATDAAAFTPADEIVFMKAR